MAVEVCVASVRLLSGRESNKWLMVCSLMIKSSGDV